MGKENKRTMSPSFDEVIKLDQTLQYLAAYEVTGGKLLIPKHVDELAHISIKIANKFNYFKKLIQDGECTFDFIKNTVLTKNGAFPQNKINIDIDNPNCFKELDTQEALPSKNNTQLFVEKLLGSLFNVPITKIELSKLPEIKTEIPPKQKTKKNKKKRKK